MLSPEESFLQLLRTHGTMGNGKARELLGWTLAQYEVVKASLVAQGVLALGRGRGGSIAVVTKGPTELGSLQALFRTLLHELMTGKVRVGEMD